MTVPVGLVFCALGITKLPCATRKKRPCRNRQGHGKNNQSNATSSRTAILCSPTTGFVRSLRHGLADHFVVPVAGLPDDARIEPVAFGLEDLRCIAVAQPVDVHELMNTLRELIELGRLTKPDLDFRRFDFAPRTWGSSFALDGPHQLGPENAMHVRPLPRGPPFDIDEDPFTDQLAENACRSIDKILSKFPGSCVLEELWQTE